MRFPLIASGLLLATQAFAATPAEDTVRQALGQIAPNVKIEAAQESAVPGFYEAIAGGEFPHAALGLEFACGGQRAGRVHHAAQRFIETLHIVVGVGEHEHLVTSQPAVTTFRL